MNTFDAIVNYYYRIISKGNYDIQDVAPEYMAAVKAKLAENPPTEEGRSA